MCLICVCLGDDLSAYDVHILSSLLTDDNILNTAGVSSTGNNGDDYSTVLLVFGRPFVKRVRPVLSDRCPLSVMLVYCGEIVGQIKMKLGLQVGLGLGHIVLDGDPASPCKRGTAPNFRPMSVVAKQLDGLR